MRAERVAGRSPSNPDPTVPLTRSRSAVFFLFSNRLGCLPSILLSVVLTLVLLFLSGVLR